MNGTDLDLLKHLHKQQRDELNYRRSRLYLIFTWTVAILLGMIAVVVRTPQGDFNQIVWPIFGSIFVVALVLFSIRWQTAQQKDAADHAAVIVDLCDRLGAFDKKIYPARWKMEWGTRSPSKKRQIMTCLLGLITILVMWTKYWAAH